jgi:hypothetical protein
MAMRNGVIVVATLLALTACGKSGGGADRQVAAGNVAVSAVPGDIRISTPNGTAEIHAVTGAAPGAMPEGIPAYPNAIAGGENIDINGGSGQGQGHVVAFGTRDTPAQVIAFYTQAVTAAGYTIAAHMDMGPTAMLTAQRGEGQAVSIVATPGGSETRVQITASDRAR